MYDSVLAPTDGSDHSVRAARHGHISGERSTRRCTSSTSSRPGRRGAVRRGWCRRGVRRSGRGQRGGGDRRGSVGDRGARPRSDGARQGTAVRDDTRLRGRTGYRSGGNGDPRADRGEPGYRRQRDRACHPTLVGPGTDSQSDGGERASSGIYSGARPNGSSDGPTRPFSRFRVTTIR